MENNTTTIEKLIERVEVYCKTSFELWKLNAIDKASDLFSSLAVKLTLTIVVIFFFSMINVGLALWIGESLDKYYYGFFVIAAFYLLLLFILYVFRNKWIKNPVSNFVISESLKKN